MKTLEQKQRQAESAQKVREKWIAHWSEHNPRDYLKEKKCSKCGEVKSTDEFIIKRDSKTGFDSKCKACGTKYYKQYLEQGGRVVRDLYYDKWRDKGKYLYYNAKRRAKAKGLPFNLDREDIIIPTHCPVLGIPLMVNKNPESKTGDGSPSLDRLIPELGYVKGNVVVMSHKANRMKSNATLDELKLLVKFLEIKHRGK